MLPLYENFVVPPMMYVWEQITVKRMGWRRLRVWMWQIITFG